MAAVASLPTLSQSDIEQAAKLIQEAYAPQNLQASSGDQRRPQQELFELQKRPEAWGLVIPFLESSDPNVQFFGAHTAQVKITRDWESFPEANRTQLRDVILELTAQSVVIGRSKVTLRKLFVALSSLALKLAPVHPTLWPDWIMACVTYLSGRGASTESILDFLTIVAEEVETADLLGPNKARMKQTMLDAVPMVVQAVTSSISQSTLSGSTAELVSALKCLGTWMPNLPGNEITTIIPLLISRLGPVSSLSPTPDFDDDVFVSVSDTLEEVMAKSALADGSGAKTLTEPLLFWLDKWAGTIIEHTLKTGYADQTSHALCKLLVSLGDHSTSYLASNISSPSLVSAPTYMASFISAGAQATKGHLVQSFLKFLLSYTALPGYYGIDEEESEMTLWFWYLFQEALWNTNYYFEEGEDGVTPGRPDEEEAQWVVAKAVYSELVQVLRRKVKWPSKSKLAGWTKDQKEKFRCYRRDVGDTLINAYYILRGDMLGYYVNDISERLSIIQDHIEWEEVEATLHCFMSIQEAIPVEDNCHLTRLFSSEILDRLPKAGHERVRRTILGVIGTYASWFTTHAADSSNPSLLMNAVSYVVTALSEPSLCLEATNALRDLCDANRKALAPHINAFSEVHAGLTSIPDTERSKVLQSIASVIQALPPDEEIAPIEVIVRPVVASLADALHSSAQFPDEARNVAAIQLQTLSAIAKGLTRITDLGLSHDELSEDQALSEPMKRAYDDIRMANLRETIFSAIRHIVDLWSLDAGMIDALSDLFKSITSLPSDTTLISLPAGPLLELVCLASQRHLTSVWLTLASMLIVQLDPPLFSLSALKTRPSAEAEAIVVNVLPILMEASLNFLSQPGSMENNPDVVQAFFGCMEATACHFIEAFHRLPPGGLDALVHCAVSSLVLQERYSLVAACTFLGTLINCTSSAEQLVEAKNNLIQTHGRSVLRAVLCGFAGVAPRSVVPNLIELLCTIVTRVSIGCKTWMTEIMFANDFAPSKAGSEAKERFINAVMGSRSTKRIRDAAQQFTLVARGLEGTSFGYATVSM